jgi:Golgi phosphoprotein 3 (GPP34)
MTTSADLALIALDPSSGASRLGSNAEIVLGGGVLHDLLLAERLTVAGEGRKARVTVLSGTPLGSPVIDPAFAKLVWRDKPLKPSDAVTRLGKGLPRVVHADLVAQGLLEDRSRRILGAVPLRRWTVLPQAGRDELVAGVRAVLLGERTPDERFGALAALVGAAGLVKHVVPKDRRKEANRRAKTLAEGEWASEAVRAAIKASGDAVAIAVVAGGDGGGDGGSS